MSHSTEPCIQLIWCSFPGCGWYIVCARGNPQSPQSDVILGRSLLLTPTLTAAPYTMSSFAQFTPKLINPRKSEESSPLLYTPTHCAQYPAPLLLCLLIRQRAHPKLKLPLIFHSILSWLSVWCTAWCVSLTLSPSLLKSEISSSYEQLGRACFALWKANRKISHSACCCSSFTLSCHLSRGGEDFWPSIVCTMFMCALLLLAFQKLDDWHFLSLYKMCCLYPQHWDFHGTSLSSHLSAWSLGTSCSHFSANTCYIQVQSDISL